MKRGKEGGRERKVVNVQCAKMLKKRVATVGKMMCGVMFDQLITIIRDLIQDSGTTNSDINPGSRDHIPP